MHGLQVGGGLRLALNPVPQAHRWGFGAGVMVKPPDESAGCPQLLRAASGEKQEV